MAYIITPGLGLKLADPGTIQAFETVVINDDFLALENGIAVEAARVAEILTYDSTRPRGSGIAAYKVATIAARDALTTMENGDTAFVTDTNIRYRRTAGAWAVGKASGAFARSADFVLTSGAFVAVPFQSAPTLHGLTWLLGTNPSRVTCTIAGTYLISANPIVINTTGNGDVRIQINGATLLPIVSVPNSAGAASFPFAQVVTLAVGDYIEILAQTSGGAFPWKAANVINVDMVAAR